MTDVRYSDDVISRHLWFVLLSRFFSYLRLMSFETQTIFFAADDSPTAKCLCHEVVR